jgi:hypothetical protein
MIVPSGRTASPASEAAARGSVAIVSPVVRSRIDTVLGLVPCATTSRPSASASHS